MSTSTHPVEIKTDSIVTPQEREAIYREMNPTVPPVGSTVALGGFMYRVRKVTKKDLVLRPVGLQ